MKYKKHPSIIATKSKYRDFSSFSFVKVNKANIEKEIVNLNGIKDYQKSNLPTKVIKENLDIFSRFLCTSFNSSIKTSTFPQCLNVQKENYRPVSILPNLPKISKRCIFKQMSQLFESTLSNHQCGFHKGLSTQQSLLVLLEKWKKSVDRGRAFCALLKNLSKAFDCFDHELLISKLCAYGFILPCAQTDP